jgi:hypothetical protein
VAARNQARRPPRLAFVRAGRLRLQSRNGYDVTDKFAAALTGISELGCDLVLDGEVGVPDEHGVTHLDDLTDAIRHRRSERLAYFAFDLLHLDGRDLRGCALVHRKAALQEQLERAQAPRTLYIDHIEGDGATLLPRSAARCRGHRLQEEDRALPGRAQPLVGEDQVQRDRQLRSDRLRGRGARQARSRPRR